MNSNIRPWRAWFLPFLVSGGMAFGAFIGMTSLLDVDRQEGPAGDMAGAAGALMLVICIVVGFVMAMLTVIVAKVLRRRIFNRIALRFGLSIVGGGIIGALGSNDGDVATAAAWLLLIGLPILLAWPWQAQVVSDVKTRIK